MKSRLLSLALALALCMGLVPPVSAAVGRTQNLSDSYEVFYQDAPGNWYWEAAIPRVYGLKDKAGNVVIPAKYTGMYLFQDKIIAATGAYETGSIGPNVEHPKYGIIDINQNVLLPFQYERIVPMSDTGRLSCTSYVYESEGFSGQYFIQQKGLLGVMAGNYSVIIQPAYYHLELIASKYYKISNTYNDKAMPGMWPSYGATDDCVWALYDMDGKQVLPAQYNRIDDLGDGLFAVKKGGLSGVVNGKNQVIVPLVYQDVVGRHESAFIVTDYRAEYKNKPKDDEVYWLGNLWKHQGIVGVGGKVLVDFEKYQKIKVDSVGRFTCSVWTGDYIVTGYMGAGGGDMQPIYGNEYTYEYINYTDLDITTDVSDLTSPFADVGFTDYFAEPVKWAVSKGITTGTSGTKFSPDEKCTHIQILTFLYRAVEQIKAPSAADMEKAVAWAQEKGMLAPDFNRSKPCTRAEAVYYIWQAMGRQDAPASNFIDVDANAFYAKAIDWTVVNEVTNGTSATTFSPNDTCTRGQIATFLHRAMG